MFLIAWSIYIYLASPICPKDFLSKTKYFGGLLKNIYNKTFLQTWEQPKYFVAVFPFPFLLFVSRRLGSRDLHRGFCKVQLMAHFIERVLLLD